ncbi:MAG: SDR family oxidoreductase [Anaerolineae bacterium]|jgi:NAD(P)-dependent dehydrogenase (short-subunit alcohol dehydrogenase family)
MNERVLITGANRGIGLELVRQCLEQGDHVFAGCRQPQQATELHALAAAHPGQLSVLTLDVTDQESLDASRETVRAQVEALDVLFNNAAVHLGDETIRDLDVERLVRTFRVNAVGPVLVAQCYLDLLKAGNAPRIVNISSEAGSISKMERHRGYAYYGSKAALNMFTRALAWDENVEGVVVVAVHPGWVRTDMGGSMAPVAPADSAQGILRVTAGLTRADSGKFYTYQGDEYPW